MKGGLVLLSAVAVADAACFTHDKCISHVYSSSGDITYSWDLRPLCRSPGNEYTWTDSFNHTYNWNICGTVDRPTAICTPPWTVYVSHGVMTQFWTDTPSCAGGPDGTCTDPERGGQAVCCTGDCSVIAHDKACDYQLLDASNPATGGITWTHAGMPPDASDPFECSTDPTTGCSKERQLSVKLYCDTSSGAAADSFTFLGISEPSQCSYLLEARAKAACGTTGDPFDPGQDSGGQRFGYVVLGAFLTVGLSFTYSFGDNRGWWNGIKSRIPSVNIPFIGTIGGSKGGVYGGGGYKPVAPASATPITASAYGST
jgi:hypothetical protein